MKKMISTLICALTFLALLCSVAVPALAVEPAQAPDWEKGDKWAYGMETDVGAEFEPYLVDLTEMLEGETSGTVNELSLDGTVGFWMLFEVTEANNDIYVLSMDLAGKLELDAAVSVTANMPEAGVYDINEEIGNDSMEEMDISVEASIDAAIVINVDVTFDSDTMAIESIAMNAKINLDVEFTANNIPIQDENTTYDWVNWTEVGTKEYSYDDYDVSGELELNLALDLEFAPALNIWDFPLAVGDEWTAYSEATLSGSLTGSLDVQGLPEDMMDSIFTDEFIASTGFSDFPIIFEELSGGEGSPFDEGVLDEVTEDIDIDLKCTNAITIEDEYWGEITVYKIKAQNTPLEFYYSPEVGFMSYFSMNTDDIDDVIDMNLPGMISEELKMEAVDPEVAEQNIEEISDYQGDIGGGGEGGLVGFFTDAPYLGLILIGVIAVIVVAAVLLIRKK